MQKTTLHLFPGSSEEELVLPAREEYREAEMMEQAHWKGFLVACSAIREAGCNPLAVERFIHVAKLRLEK